MKTTLNNKLIPGLFITLLFWVNTHVMNAQCNASFTYTIGQNGSVSFMSTCTGTTNATQISWSFGQYFSPAYATGPSAVATNTSSYFNYVCIYATDSVNNINCSFCDSIMLNNNPCTSNVSMSLYKDSTQALTWNAYAYYDQNVTGATWNWGDGTTTNGLFPSHTYSAAGIYTICVTETVSCGATSSVCSSQFINKGEAQGAMIKLNVKNPKTQMTGLQNETFNTLSTSKLYPNPSAGNTYIDINLIRSSQVNIKIFDITGTLVSETSEILNEGNNRVNLNTRPLNAGIYIVSLNEGQNNKNLRLIKQ